MRSLRLEVSESSSQRAVFVKLIGGFDMANEALFRKRSRMASPTTAMAPSRWGAPR